MAYVKGQEDLRRFTAALPARAARVLRGAAKAGADVVAEEARAEVISSEVRDSVKTATKREENRVVGLIQTKGPGAYIAPWLEYGTDAHFITVDESDRRGMSVGRINKLQKEGSLVINGRFVGPSIHHPGAKPYPFLRPALDRKEGEAIAAAQSYINSRWSPSGLASATDDRDDG